MFRHRLKQKETYLFLHFKIPSIFVTVMSYCITNTSLHNLLRTILRIHSNGDAKIAQKIIYFFKKIVTEIKIQLTTMLRLPKNIFHFLSNIVTQI